MTTFDKKHGHEGIKLNIFRFREQAVKHMRDTTIDEAKEQFLISLAFFNDLEPDTTNTTKESEVETIED